MDNQDNINENENEQAISAFEGILQIVPNDVFALEALHDAYLEKGQTEIAYKHLKILAGLMEDVNDPDTLTRISDKLLFLEAEFPEASRMAGELEERAQVTLSPQSPTPDGGDTSDPSSYKGGIHQEIALAWNLYENKQIGKDEYTSITNDLTETSSQDVNVPVSVMHAIYDRAEGNTEKIVAYIAKNGCAPLISLKDFELRMNAVELLPSVFMNRFGAIPIDFIGEELMVAILNPFNKELKERIGKQCKRKCHFYLVTAPDYDQRLEMIRGSLLEQE